MSYVTKHRIKPIPEFSTQLIYRFMSYIDKRGHDECWPWLGKPDNHGYGVFSIPASFGIDGPARQFRASRISIKLATGVDPGPYFACHSCDNPICVNPAHLSPGTQSQNIQHRTKPWNRGEKHGRAKLTEAQVREIRKLRASGELLRVIAERYGVSLNRVSELYRGKSWKHLNNQD